MKGKKHGEKVKHHVEHHHEKGSHAHVEHHHMKKGGKAMKADGHKAHHRADKRARGGRMTPKSPISGAMPGGLPGGGKAQSTTDKSND